MAIDSVVQSTRWAWIHDTARGSSWLRSKPWENRARGGPPSRCRGHFQRELENGDKAERWNNAGSNSLSPRIRGWDMYACATIHPATQFYARRLPIRRVFGHVRVRCSKGWRFVYDERELRRILCCPVNRISQLIFSFFSFNLQHRDTSFFFLIFPFQFAKFFVSKPRNCNCA